MGAGSSRKVEIYTREIIGGVYPEGAEELGTSIAYEEDMKISSLFRSPKGYEASEEVFMNILNDLKIKYGFPKEMVKKRKVPRDASLKSSLEEAMGYNIIASAVALDKIAKEYTKIRGEKLIENFNLVSGNKKVQGIHYPFGGNNTIVLSTSAMEHGLMNDIVSAKRGWGVTNDWGAGTMIHELGHAIDMRLRADPSTSKYVEGLEKKAMRTLEAVSVYGSTSHKEAFAEAFALYARGKTKPNNQGRGDEYYKEFKNVMEKSGLKTLYGVATYEDVYNTTRSMSRSKFSTVVNRPPKGRTERSSTQSTSGFSTRISNGVATLSVGGKIYTMAITSSRKKRGYMTKTIEGVTYKINTKNGNMEIVNKE